MEISFEDRISFLDNIIKSLIINKFESEEKKEEWLKIGKRFYGEEKFEFLMFMYYYSCTSLDDVRNKITQLREQQQELQLRELEIRETTKRKEIQEATKRIEERELKKRKEIEERELIKRKEYELEMTRITEQTKRLNLSRSSSRFDSSYNYYEKFFTDRESLITPFEVIFDHTSLDYSGVRHEMEWLSQTLINQDQYQHLFNEFLKEFGTKQTISQRLVIYNQTSRLYYCDTHTSHDDLVKERKPDITVYFSNRNGEYPGPNPFKFCFFMELQLDDFDTYHAHDIIRRSEVVMNRTPQRSHAYTLWLTKDSLVVHKVKRVNGSFDHTFSTTISLNDEFGKNILYFFLICANPDFFGVPELAPDIENYLITNNYTPTDYLGGGAFSQVLKISTSDSKSYTLKIYKSLDAKHLHLKSQEVDMLRKLEDVNAVPSIIHEENNWILLDKVCEL